MRRPPLDDRALGWTVVVSVVVVLGAVGLEMLAGAAANSTVPVWADGVVPLAWPAPARVAWWLAVAAIAGVGRWAMHRLGFRQRPAVVVLSVAPFVVFAGGIVAGAGWATWH